MKFFYKLVNFSTVHVKITNEKDTNNDSYNKFMDYWENNYVMKKHFHLFFDFESLYIPKLTRSKINLCIDFIRREKEMKKSEIQYLDYSIVVVNNPLIIKILNGIWNICPPLNTVYLVTEMSVGLKLLKFMNNPFFSEKYINLFIKIHNIKKCNNKFLK